MPGRHTVIRTTIHLALAAALSAGVATARAAAPKPVPPELPAETLASGGTLAGATSERIYVADVMIFNIADGRLRVFDARAGRLLGMVNTGYAGNFALGAKADELFVATTYLSRGGRGDRTDVLEVWDTQTLAFKYEVLLPPKRAQTLNYRGMVSVTGNGRFVLVQNATPATSITVVDLAEKKVATEVQTPGCWGSWPASGGARFSMLCGDGKVATVTLDDKGQVADRQLSDKLFDADQDAWFHTAERIGDRFFFLSFKGTITELDLSGPSARVLGSRPIAGSPQDAKGNWRPGGYQAFAVHPAGRHAVVAMHDGGREGSHKLPAKQLWVVDLATGKKLGAHPGHGSASLTFSKSGQRLQALDGMTGALNVWDWTDGGKLKKASTVKTAGQAALHLESHD
jgi:methylamine dehydrogenase heavy chain